MTDANEESPTMPEVNPQNLVTEDHVKAALKADKGSEANLLSWSIVDFTNRGDNYACVVTSVKVNFSLHQENTEVVYIVKLNPCRNVASFKIFTKMIFEKEVKFYRKLLPELNAALTEVGLHKLRFPNCIYGCLEADKEILFLEDLRPAGFRMFDRRQGLDVAHATLILEELARLHAASRLLQDKTPDQDLSNRHPFLLKDWTTNHISGMETILEFIDCQIGSAVEMLDKIGGYESSKKWAENLRPQIQDIFDEHFTASKYSVVCHGDCWNNNILFRYDKDGKPEEVMLLDLQINRWASPANDLNYLLYTSFTGEVRKVNLKAFLTTYHTTFTTVMETAGKEIMFTQEELLEEFRDKNIIGAIFAMMLLPLVLVEPEQVPDLSLQSDEEYDNLLTEMKEVSLDVLDKNPLLKPRFLAVFDDLIESGLIS